MASHEDDDQKDKDEDLERQQLFEEVRERLINWAKIIR